MGGWMEVEDAFREVKSYLEVRPVYHYRPDRVRNHIRLCFFGVLAECAARAGMGVVGERGEVVRILRQLQKIRVGMLTVQGRRLRAVWTEIPKPMNELLSKLGLLQLFSLPPAWVGL